MKKTVRISVEAELEIRVRDNEIRMVWLKLSTEKNAIYNDLNLNDDEKKDFLEFATKVFNE